MATGMSKIHMNRTTEQQCIPQKFPAFQSLKTVPWQPKFHQVRTVRQAANSINQPHEDYPRRVPDTEQTIQTMLKEYPTPGELSAAFNNENLLRVHRLIFSDTPHGGQWRQVRVQVGQHLPPAPDLVPKLMQQLETAYQDQVSDLKRLTAWYDDFETIHPFQDGNGRVGGVMLALASHRLAPAQGFLAPGQ